MGVRVQIQSSLILLTDLNALCKAPLASGFHSSFCNLKDV